MKQTFVFLFLFFLLPGILVCQEQSPQPGEVTPLPEDLPQVEEESPGSIFTYQIGDAEVDFFIEGYWTFTFFAAVGFLITPEGGVRGLDIFPSFVDGFYFQQDPDLTLSVWLMEKYFLEITYRGEDETNLFLTGYEGEEEELVQHVYIGNTDISLSPSPFLKIPEVGNSSIGTHTLLHTPASQHELLLRYDYNTSGKRVFKGNNEVVEIRFSPEEYMRGRYFKLPDNTIENADVYIQDPYGTFTDEEGRKFRKAGAKDMVLDVQKGSLYLKEESIGRILIYYTKSEIPVGDPLNGTDALAGEDSSKNSVIDVDAEPVDFSFTLLEHLGQDMTDREVLLSNDQSCLLLYEPGLFSSFEILSTYEVADGFPNSQWMVETSIVKKGTYKEYTLTTPVSITSDNENQRLIVYADDDLRNNFRNLYPFIDTSQLIYGPEQPGGHSASDYEILLELLYPVTEYYLDPDVIPGSVQVIRNGFEENRFFVDYESGIIIFQVDILPTDRLEVFYKRKFESFGNGDIVFGWKNTIDLSDSTFLELSTGLKWNAIPGTYTEKAYTKTGSILGLCSFQTSTEHFDLALSGAASFTNPDTTGIFRLLGMEEAGLDVFLSEETATLCSVPADHDTETFPELERGKLFYKNYREYGIAGSSTLKPVTWDIPGDQVFPYETNSKPGPYLVSDTPSSSKGSSLVMDFEIPVNKKWTGIQIPVITDRGTTDLSLITSLSLSYMSMDLTGEVSMYVQIGEIEEDIDNDAFMDEESSSTSTGYIFNDESNGVDLRIGSGPKNRGNNRKDSEDIDGNRFLDPEVTERIVSRQRTLSSSAGESSWQTLNFFFSQEEKKKLARTRFIRIVISTADDETELITGKLLINRIFLAGEVHWQKTRRKSSSENTNALKVREIFEEFAKMKPETHLEVADPDVKRVFHPRGEPQKVLEARWTTIIPGEEWELSYTGLPQVEGIRYDELNLYFRLLKDPGAEELVTFSLLDPDNRGIRVGLTLESIPAWKKLTINMKTEKVYLDSEEINAVLKIDEGYLSFTKFSVSLTDCVQESARTLYIDEVHLTSPQLELGAAVSLETKAEFSGPIITVRGIPVLADIFISEKASFMTKGFTPLYGQTAPAMLTQSLTEVSFGLLFSELNMDLSITGEDDVFSYAGGHSLIIPGEQSLDEPFPVQLIDKYTMTPGESGNNFYRSNSCTVKDKEENMVFFLSTSSHTIDSILVQNWDSRVSLLFKKLFSFSTLCSYLVSSDSFKNTNDWYIPAWFYGFQYVIPVENSILDERSGRVSFDISLTTKPVGTVLTGNVQTGSNNIEENSRDYASNTDMLLSFPVTIALTEVLTFILTPSYSRALSTKNFYNEQGTFSTDVHQWYQDLEDHSYVFTGIPFYELFSKSAEDVFSERTMTLDTDSVTYTPLFSFSLAKESSGSGLIDLFLPSSFEFSLTKQFQKNFALYDFFNTYTISARFYAINLFGKFGAYSLCDLYTVDQFETNVSMNIVTREEDITYEYEFINFMSFADSKQNKVLIENHLLFHQDEFFDIIDFGSLTYEWNIIPEKHLPIPLIPKQAISKSYYTHKESLTYTFNNYADPLLLSNITITLGHTSALKFPPNGYIQAGITVGYNIESTTPDYHNIQATRIAVQAGVEAQIKW